MRRKNRIQTRNIQQKIISIFLIIIIMLAISGSAVVWTYLNTSYKNQLLYDAEQEVQKAIDTISGEVENAFHISYVIQYDDTISEILRKDPEQSIEEQYKDMWAMDSALNSVVIPLSMEPVSIYVDDRMVYAGNNALYRKKSELLQYQQFEELEKTASPFIWIPRETVSSGPGQEKDYISFLRKIGENNDPAGYMRVNIDAAYLGGILKDMCVLDEEASCILGDDLTEIIAESDSEKMELILKASERSGEKNSENSTVYGEWERITAPDGEKVFLSFETVSGTPWTMAAAVPVRVLQKDIYRLLGVWTGIILIVSILALRLASGISASITRRIRLLEHNMGNLAKGHFEKMQEDEEQDEITGLIRHYNIAINQMIDFQEKRYKSMKKLQGARLKILQSQINPHFLYNTLDLIHWEAMEGNAERISGIVQALADFYRLSLNEGRECVSIHDEINHVISYLEIIDYKYRHRIQYEIEIPSEMYGYLIPKITLQPLVENAVLHGLLEMDPSESAELEIYGWTEGNDLYIQISDNGAGIEKEKLDSLLVKKTTPADGAVQRHGFGVRNIHERIRMLYGEGYGLSFQSAPGEGTTVIVKTGDHLLRSIQEDWMENGEI